MLVTIDCYNDFFRMSELESVAYANYKYKIPPAHIALVRLFIRFDGHRIRNGMKVCASSQNNYFNSKFDIDMIDFLKGYHHEVAPLHLNDSRNFINYLIATKWTDTKWPEWGIEAFHVESQGNFKGIMESMKRTHHYDI